MTFGGELEVLWFVNFTNLFFGSLNIGIKMSITFEGEVDNVGARGFSGELSLSLN
jgi:hypothetical protein